jgi:hypothetical protein
MSYLTLHQTSWWNTLVTYLFDTTGPITPPCITILAAPSMATCDTSSTGLGVSFDNIWDEAALTGFDPALDLTSIHCLVLAAHKGYSCQASTTSHVESLLLDAQVILIPEGQLFWASPC